ncbi:MAG TPA: LacI family DNA-binding transcriptional regulator [Solirubrobacteraceae bacterium]|jgi:LacI family transcriptional regulator|nr:LacI family DNA-binding transcriptional regulator [Solirubrobacteraceae bacterium]
MNDLAISAGVSLKTVSRVINGEPGVTAATLQKVEAAIESLGYARNDLAASLRRGVSSNTIGLVIEDVANPFYALVAQAVEDIAREHASLLITTSAREDPPRERELVTALLRRRVDALLIVPAGADHRYIARAGFAGHTVFLDRPPIRTDADTVLIDNAAGAQLAVTHLLRQGHRRIAIVGDTQALYTAGERLDGYTTALGRAGVTVSDGLVSMGHSTWESANATVAQLLELPASRRPTAIFAANNRCTIGAMHALHGAAGEVALVGFDEFELADLLGVTVVRTDPYRIGQVGAQIAFSRIDGDERPAQRVMLPVDLIVRGSGEISV